MGCLYLRRLWRRPALEPAAEAEQLAQPGEALGLVHRQVKNDDSEGHEADHGADPEALHAGGDQAGFDHAMM